MSEYIEREALREELRHCCIVDFDEKSGEPYVIDIPQLLRRTTVSAEVVVHCGECRFRQVANDSTYGTFYVCGYNDEQNSGLGGVVQSNEHCSYGKRRESEAGK